MVVLSEPEAYAKSLQNLRLRFKLGQKIIGAAPAARIYAGC